MDTIYASSLKGFCSLPLCWQFLREVSEQLDAIHAGGEAHGRVDLGHVVIEGDRFVLVKEDSSTGQSTASDIWSLAASAFELMIGSPIFNGTGEESQNKNMPIPSLPQPEAETLNRLLHGCLSMQKSERPTAVEIKTAVTDALARIGHQERSSRVHAIAHTQEQLDIIDRQWPERMISGSLRGVVVLLVLMFSTTFSCLQAQVKLNAGEEVTQDLLDAVLLLRHSDVKSWNQAQDELEKWLSKFTLMNELQDRENDCLLINSQVKSFGVNRIVSELKRGNRVQNSGRELLDGADVRFNYSLYEKGVKMGRTATYTMSGRSGKQVFLVVPFTSSQPYSVELVKADGTAIPSYGKDANGITYFEVDQAGGPAPGETLTLRITNKDASHNASFVIINHNYRDKK